MKKFGDWTLLNFIDAACDIGLIKEDMKKLAHLARDYRNYIYPNKQLKANFFPDRDTAKILFEALKICNNQLIKNQKLVSST